MTEPLRAHTYNESRYYLMVTPCGACGKGPWQIDAAEGPGPADAAVAIRAHCRQCNATREFRFICEFQTPEGDAEALNPSDQPSRIIDLGQWLSLFYLLVESAAKEEVPSATRRTGYRAALCLAEALKFYGDDELPPPSAFFTETSARAFREHPEKFAKQKLRDMQSKLPPIAKMARRVARDGEPPRRKWWRFWRR